MYYIRLEISEVLLSLLAHLKLVVQDAVLQGMSHI